MAENESLSSSSEDEDEDKLDSETAVNDGEYIVDEDMATADMVAIIVQLEINADLEFYLLRYYYSLATTPAKMTEVLQKVKDRVKECLMVAHRMEILKHVKTHGIFPKKVRLQAASEFVEDKRDALPPEDESVPGPRRKMSESLQSYSDLMPGYQRDRTGERKATMADVNILEIMSKKDFEYPELITGSESYKTSIFFSVRSDLVQNTGNIIYLPQLSSLDDLYFILNDSSLVKMSCSIIEKEPMKLIDPKSSFTEAAPLNSSIVEPPKKTASAKPAERKEKIVTKMITVSIYATELKGGESEIIYTLINNLIGKNLLENFRRFIRRMGIMRADSTLARYFLSEEPKEFKFQYPKVNDKTNFLLILKNNLHLLMSKVTGTLDTVHTQRDALRHAKTISPFHSADPDDGFDKKFAASQGDLDISSKLLQPSTKVEMTASCTDTVFFFNYNDSNENLFGPVLFFLNIVQDNLDFDFFSEFQANDGQYSCLVNRNDQGQLEFDSFELEGTTLKPRLGVVNGIKHIRFAKDAPPQRGIDQIVFHVNSR